MGNLHIPLILILCVALGFTAHIIKKIIEYRTKNNDFNVISYLKLYPYHLLLNVLLTTGMTLGLYEIDQLNGITAFFCGYASNSIISIMRARLDNVAQNSGSNKGKDPTDPNSDL